jgi:hypothetical protein
MSASLAGATELESVEGTSTPLFGETVLAFVGDGPLAFVGDGPLAFVGETVCPLTGEAAFAFFGEIAFSFLGDVGLLVVFSGAEAPVPSVEPAATP